MIGISSLKRHFFLISLMILALAISAAVALAADAAGIVNSLAKEKAEKTQPIENVEALDNFYAALALTAAKKPGALTRVAHFGDSLIEMDLLSGQTRRRLQTKWGDGGHGFVLVSPSKAWYHPMDLYYKPDLKWMGNDMSMMKLRDRRFGLGGAVAICFKAKAKTVVGTDNDGPVGHKVSRFDILFPIEPDGGEVEIKVDGKSLGVINTNGPSFTEGYARIDMPDDRHKLEIKAMKPKTRMYGVIMESKGPGVVYDSLGVNGTGVSSFLKLDHVHWSEQLRHRNPNLVILGFGTNEATSTLDPKRYQRKVERIVKIVKEALPGSSVLIMAPVDKAKKQGTSLVSNSAITKVVEAQRAAAKASGAALWSTFDAMGGEGSMARWYNSTPRLGAGDLMHPTPEGGKVLGDMFYNALMQGFADYLAKKGVPSSAPAAPATTLQKVEIK